MAMVRRRPVISFDTLGEICNLRDVLAQTHRARSDPIVLAQTHPFGENEENRRK